MTTHDAPDFLWGVATGAHQTEGNNLASDWWTAEHAPGSVVKEPSGDAVDSYHRWREDMDLAAAAGFTDYRFGIEWARIEPANGAMSRAEKTSARGYRPTWSPGYGPTRTSLSGAEVTGLRGWPHLSGITVTSREALAIDRPCKGLICFVGAQPATDWLIGLRLDADGFVRTDVDLTPDVLDRTWAALGRALLPFETSCPAVFAVGDMRRGSMKRVASAVSEGASVTRSVHLSIGVRRGDPPTTPLVEQTVTL
jgi:hypothetical protein